MGFWSKVGSGALKGAGGMLGGIGKATIFGAEATGKATIGLGKRIGTNASQNILKTAIAVGTGTIAAGTLADIDGNTDRGKAMAVGAGIGIASAAIPGATSVMAYMGTAGAASLLGAAEGMSRLGSKFLKMPKNLSLANTDEIKLTTLGKGAVFGSALVEGVKDAANYFKRSRMGVNDGMLRTPTPVVPIQRNDRQPSYANNGGATGDLVFALNNLRNG